jgi:hypothetical protein
MVPYPGIGAALGSFSCIELPFSCIFPFVKKTAKRFNRSAVYRASIIVFPSVSMFSSTKRMKRLGI